MVPTRLKPVPAEYVVSESEPGIPSPVISDFEMLSLENAIAALELISVLVMVSSAISEESIVSPKTLSPVPSLLSLAHVQAVLSSLRFRSWPGVQSAASKRIS